MTLNYIWIGFFIVAFLVAIFKTFTGNPEIFSLIVNSIFERAELGFKLSIGLTGIMALWLGIMRIGEKGGAINLLSRAFAPLFQKLFPEIPKDSKAHGAIIMNISANVLGLDNAATPLGLKAMEELQKENAHKEKASNAQILFLVLNTSGLTLIPTSIIALRASANTWKEFSQPIPKPMYHGIWSASFRKDLKIEGNHLILMKNLRNFTVQFELLRQSGVPV